ncbi:RsmD family RNA methyltransferase [Ktedonobacteria bacterium brp13]|nr:RsmD family RNA methyltransferase [Ktedonobacteria bacterium brp13]
MRVVTGAAKGKRLKSPKTVGTRPIMDRVKTALFDILSDEVDDARFLDLFAGTGGVGIEALSRGAEYATFIEMNPKIVQLVRENLLITGLTAQGEVIQGDSFKFLQAHMPASTQNPPVATPKSTSKGPTAKGPVQRERAFYLPMSRNGQPRTYDIIYVAPPQYEEMAARALRMLDAEAVNTENGLLAKEGQIIIQIHPKERPGIVAVECEHYALTDERRYGSTLLLFYRRHED